MFEKPDWLKEHEKQTEESLKESMEASILAARAAGDRHAEVMGALREIIQLLTEIIIIKRYH